MWALVFGPRSWLGKWKRKAETESWNGRLKRKAGPIQYKHRNTRALDDFRPSKGTSQFSFGLCWMGITLWVFDIWRHTVTTVAYFRSYNWGEPERAPPGQFRCLFICIPQHATSYVVHTWSLIQHVHGLFSFPDQSLRSQAYTWWRQLTRLRVGMDYQEDPYMYGSSAEKPG